MHSLYLPNILLDNTNGWGISVNLNALRSRRGWSIADFRDLRDLVLWGHEQGASFIALQSIFRRIQGYLLYDFIYLNIDLIADFEESIEIQREIYSPEFQQKLDQIQKISNLHDDEFRAFKLSALNKCYSHFHHKHLKKNSWRSSQFRIFQEKEGEYLRHFAILQALEESYGPEIFNEKNIDLLKQDFVITNYERVEFFEYLQWQIELQLALIGELCLGRQMPLGLCLILNDLPVNKNDVSALLSKAMRYAGALIIDQPNLFIGASGPFVDKNELFECLTLHSQIERCAPIIKSIEQPDIEKAAKELGFAVVEKVTLQDENSFGLPQLYEIARDSSNGDITKGLVYFELEKFMHGQGDIEDVTQNEEVREATKKLRSLLQPSIKPEKNITEAYKTIIPKSTYRLQFNKDFTLQDANKLVPYLCELGISHIYASPILQASRGSMHGYDITGHNKINPEIGSLDDLRALCANLKERDMGLILDIVPNHMGIGTENNWWKDVLENGFISTYADYFDIDWRPVKKELTGKVLLPILGEPYGNVLQEGQIKLHFHAEQGNFLIHYFEHELPLDPLSYPTILGRRLDILKKRFDTVSYDVDEYLSILSAFELLSKEADSMDRLDILREKHVHTRRLANLSTRNQQIADFIRQNTEEFEVNGINNSAAKFLHGLLEQQNYRLSFWRVSSDEINYRRFFDVDSLAAIRTEDARVFAETHHLVFSLIKENVVQGLRVDHPDGLYDPKKYFDDLQEESAEVLDLTPVYTKNDFRPESAPIYVVVEKILAAFEHLPNEWKVHGTTGYDYLNAALKLLLDIEAKDRFEQIYADFVGKYVDSELIKLECKDIILNVVLASELNVLAHRLSQIAELNWQYRDFTLGRIRNALHQVVRFFPVYRTYSNGETIDAPSRRFIDWAISAAKKMDQSVNAGIYDFLRSILTLDILNESKKMECIDTDIEKFKDSVCTFAMKFQQFTGPVMAKSIEDTFFYRYNRFICLNEVGGEAERFGLTSNAFHFSNQQKQQKYPYGMLATSTHDTKRSEDVRARLAVLSEITDIWREKVFSWQEMNKACKTLYDSQIAPDNNDEYLLYQTILGALPLGWNNDNFPPKDEIASFVDRIKNYALKAVREAKLYTSWVNQNADYEKAIISFIEKILQPTKNNIFLNDILSFHMWLSKFGLVNSLTQTTLKITSPGIPDIYQGCEIYNYSLVDPDNRRKVNYEHLEALLTDIQTNLRSLSKKEYLQKLLTHEQDEQLKLFTTTVALNYRNKYPELFTKGRYIPLEITGEGGEHAIAYARLLNTKFCLTVVPLRAAKLLRQSSQGLDKIQVMKELMNSHVWKQTKVLLPNELANVSMQNIFSGETLSATDFLECSDIFKEFPVALIGNI